MAISLQCHKIFFCFTEITKKMPIRDSLNANAKLNNNVNLAKEAFTKFYLIHNQNVDQILNLMRKKSFDLIGKNCSNFFSKNSVWNFYREKSPWICVLSAMFTLKIKAILLLIGLSDSKVTTITSTKLC